MRHVLWAFGALVIVALAALLGVQSWVSAAYHFANAYPLASVTGKNDLTKLGRTSVAFTSVGLLIVALAALTTTLMLLIGWRTRRDAWIASLAAVLPVVIVVAIGTTLFEPPPPDGTG